MFIGSMIGSLLLIYVLSEIIGRNFLQHQEISTKNKRGLIYATLIIVVAFLFIGAALSIGAIFAGLILLAFNGKSSTKSPITVTPESSLSETNATAFSTQVNQTNEKDAALQNKILNFWLSLGLIIFAITVFIIVTNSPSPKSSGTEKSDTQISEINNPIYKEKPSFYLLDKLDEVDAKIPLESPVFVERVKRLEDNKMLILEVSYPTVVADKNIFKVEDIYVPGVTMLVCNDAVKEFLEQNIVGKNLFLTIDSINGISTFFTPSITVMSDTRMNPPTKFYDFSKTLIEMGYAKVVPQSPMWLYGGLDENVTEITNKSSHQYYNSESGEVDADSFNINASTWYEQFVDDQQVAKLSKIGSWSCTDK